MTRTLHWCRYETLDYAQALLLQKERVAAILKNAPDGTGEAISSQRTPEGGPSLAADHLMLLEHPSVYTVGRSGRRQEILCPEGVHRSIPVCETDRGGKVTYHGPGQLVAYLIRDLRPHALASVRRHVAQLEEVAIQALAFFGVVARRDPHHPGVWVDGAKIAALGVRVCQGVAYHGIALNRDPDLRLYAGIIPCGLADRSVTSLANLGVHVSRDALEGAILSAFRVVFAVHCFVPPLRLENAP
ncbi:MAG: lipoyl(octanoyl) transferase LipB [Magnetococcus sp. YQC-3]